MPARFYGEQPFWFWNGKEMNRDEVRRQVALMHANGVRGFYLHPRQGMGVPYLGKTFFELVRVAAEAALSHGMDMWLYDEYPYPSGYAGGELLLHEEWKAKTINPVIVEARGDVVLDLPWGKVLSAKAFPIEAAGVNWHNGVDLTDHIGIVYDTEIFQNGAGLSPYNRKRFFTGGHAKRLEWSTTASKWKVCVFLECDIADFKYFGGVIDPLNTEAMSAYLKLTHDRYKKELGAYFGHPIRGIFTDETAPVDHMGVYWSRLMPELFKSKNGYDIFGVLPALFEDTCWDNEKIRYDLTNTVVQAFEASYDAPIRAWCDQAGIVYTGEKPHLRVSQMRHMHIPGIDNGHEKAGAPLQLYPTHYRAGAKAVASAAHFYGDNTALVEAYHSLGWGATLRDLRWMADSMILQGIGLVTPHAFYYSTNALRKYDAPPSLFDIMPWYRHNTAYAKHIDFTTDLVQRGKRVAPLLVLDPMPGTWSALDRRRPEENAISRIQAALAGQFLDYYIIDSDLAAECEMADGKLTLRSESFEALVLPRMPYMENESLTAVGRLAQGGARIYALEPLPGRNITHAKPIDWSAMPVRTSMDEVTLAARILREIGSDYAIEQDGMPVGGVIAAMFDLDNLTYLYVENTEREVVHGDVRISQPHNRPVALIDTVNDLHARVPATFVNGVLSFPFEFAPFASAIFCVGAKGKAVSAPDSVIDIDIHRLFPVKPCGKNLLRLGRWQASLGDCQGIVEPMPVIDQLISLGGSMPVAVQPSFGCRKRLMFPEMALTYRSKFHYACDVDVWFVIEPDSINGEHDILVNGQSITGRLAQMPFYSRANLACAITELLRPGDNEVVVTVLATRDHDGLVNPLYLAGDFSVLRKGAMWALEPQEAEASIHRQINAGLPFFAGELDFDVTSLLLPHAGKRVWMDISGWQYEHATELWIDGVSMGVRAWNPYRWDVAVPPDVSKVVLRVSTEMLGTLEGTWFDCARHETLPIEE